MNFLSNGSLIKKITSLIVSLSLAASFEPMVNASPETEPDLTASAVSEAEDSLTVAYTVEANDDQPVASTAQATDDQTVSATVEAADDQTASATVESEENQPVASTAEAVEDQSVASTAEVEDNQPVASTAEVVDDQSVASTEEAEDQTDYTRTADVKPGLGFETVETDGGVVLVGTARIPKGNGSIGAVKFVYSSSLNLNDKSLALINKELAACGVSIPDGMIYVSRSDIVSDSQLMTQTSERQAVFAVGSPSNPTVLKACKAYGSVEESFERLYPGYIFTITGYSSLRSVLEGRDGVTLSDDGQTASTSIVMSEDYVEKVINGKKIRILMINSELKYYFRAPKLTFVKDQDYVSDSDIIYHYPTRSTTDPSDTLTTVETDPTNITSPFIEDEEPTSATTEPTEPTKDDTASTEPTIDDSTTSDFWDDDTTEATQPTQATTESDDDWWNTTEPTNNNDNTDPTRLIPYAQPINPIPTNPTTETPTFPTSDSTTEPTQKPTITLPTAMQPTQQDSIINPLDDDEPHPGGPAYIKTRRLPLNIRTGPGLNYRVIKVMPKGTRLTVLDASNAEWYLVRLKNGTVGYAFSYYIRFL